MDFNLRNFLSFERMITPILIKVLFWIGLAASAISGIVLFFSRLVRGFAIGGFGQILSGLLVGLILGILTFVGGALVARIYSELLILAFRINETLTDIKDLLNNQQF